MSSNLYLEMKRHVSFESMKYVATRLAKRTNNPFKWLDNPKKENEEIPVLCIYLSENMSSHIIS